jgi:hypothetical protein
VIGPRHQDDRGKPVRLLLTGYRSADAGGWRRFLVQAWGNFRAAKGGSAVTSALVLIGAIIAAWLLTREVITLFFFSPVGSTLVVMWAVLVLSVGQLWKTWPHWVRDTHLLAGACPVCAYGLSGQPLHTDGCVVCPECASAWNLADAQATVADRSVVVVQDDQSMNTQSSERSSPPMSTLETKGDANS